MIDITNPLIYIPEYFKVITKADKKGISQLVPMNLWKAQEYYIGNRTHRDIVVKNRQVGLSTGVEADNSHKVFTTPYTRMSIITHDTETSEFLLQNIHRFHRHLPDNRKPEVDWASSSRIRFPKMDCYIYIDSAQSAAIGIGHTLNIAHLSEMSRWPEYKAPDLFAGISQTVPEGGWITIESTPKGRGNTFYRIYDAAKKGDINYKPFFFPWWWDQSCVRDVEEKLFYNTEEKLLVEKENLSPEQIRFRREKIAEIGELFYQEYPENDVDCWLSSDVSIFDGVAIRRYLLQVNPGRTSGDTTIWKGVIGGEKYVIGVDTAGGNEKGDYSVAAVLRCKTNEYVARIRGRIAPDLFAQEIMRLGHHYNDAQIAVEKIMHGHTILRILMEAGYPDIYEHEDYDMSLGATSSKPGWNTSAKTKPIMIDDFNSALRANDISLWSENLLLEASGAIWQPTPSGKQKLSKSPGGYDDELDAVMIALQIRNQIPIFDTPRQSAVSYISI